MTTSNSQDLPQNQRADYCRRLSRALWFRHSTRPNRFLFAPSSSTGLVIAPLGTPGANSLTTQLNHLPEHTSSQDYTGALLVDDDGRFVFCGRELSIDLLRHLADWAKRNQSDMPAVANLIDSGVAAPEFNAATDEAIRKINLGSLNIQRDPELWKGLLEATPDQVASVLSTRLPGERMWYWLSSDVPENVVPLLLQPVAWDPNRDRLDHLIRDVEAAGGRDGVTGSCMIVDDGRLQFLGTELNAHMLAGLAEWVRANAAQQPALARLWNCQLLRTAGGRVREVFEDPALWHDIVQPVAPGTLAEAASLLENMEDGEECWFWMTSAGNDGPFLSLAPVKSDPEGEDFNRRVVSYYIRFPESFKDALCGILRRLPSGAWLFSCHDPRVDHWPGIIRDLIACHAKAHPALSSLARSTLIQVANGQVTRTLPAAAAG